MVAFFCSLCPHKKPKLFSLFLSFTHPPVYHFLRHQTLLTTHSTAHTHSGLTMHEYSSTLALSQQTWLEYGSSQPEINTNNSFSSANRSRSELARSFSSSTLSRNIASPAHLSFSRQHSRGQRPANQSGLLYSQSIGNTNSLPSPVATYGLNTLPLVPNDSLTTAPESSATNSSPAASMIDSPPSSRATGTRSRPISVMNNSLSNGTGLSSQSRYVSPVRSFLPAYFPQLSANRISRNKLDHHLKSPPTPISSSEDLRAPVVQEKGQDQDPLWGRRSRKASASVSDGRVGGSVGREQSHSSSSSPLLAGSLPEFSRLLDKISSMATVVAKLQQTFNDYIQNLKHEDTKPFDAVEEACKNAVLQAQQKTEELVGSLARQTEKALEQRLDECLRKWTDTLARQLSGSTDAVQNLVQKAQTNQSTIMQDLTANLQQTFEDCLKRFEEQTGPRIIEKARGRAITLAEEKGEELVMLMVAQTEKVVQQRLEESLQSWTVTLASQLRTAVDAVQDQFRQSPYEQRPTPQHDVDVWRMQYDSCTSNEISELKLAIVELNASTHVTILLFLECHST